MAGLATARVGRDGGDVFDAANLHASASEGTKRGHTTRTRGLGSAATCQPLTLGGKRASGLDWQCASIAVSTPVRHLGRTALPVHYRSTCRYSGYRTSAFQWQAPFMADALCHCEYVRLGGSFFERYVYAPPKWCIPPNVATAAIHETLANIYPTRCQHLWRGA